MTIHTSPEADGNTVLEIRKFNRFHTRLVGALNEGILTSDYTLVQVRLMYELNHNDNLAAADLMEILKLDRGYLSRLITTLEDKGLIEKSPDPKNGKRMVLSLTKKGKQVEDELEALSSKQVADLIAPLSHIERSQLVQSMNHIQSLLDQTEPDPSYILRDPEAGDFGWIVHRHGVLYEAEQQLDHTFEGLVADIVAGYVRNHNPKRERCWIAEHAGTVAGSIFITEHDPETAKLRLLYVEPEARGLGIGKRLVSEAVKFARLKNYKKLTLWTLSSQEKAGKIYQSHGFKITSESKTEIFGQRRTRQDMELVL